MSASSSQDAAARQPAVPPGFEIPSIDLPDVARAVLGLSEAVASAAAGLDPTQADTSFASALRELAPAPLSGPSLESLVPADGAPSETRVRECLAMAGHGPVGPLAWRSLDVDRALTSASVLDGERVARKVRGPLHGMPIGLKDMFDRRGHVAGWGSAMRAGAAPASADATIVSRLEAAGAVPVGALHMAEFAMSPTGLNATYGPGINPWNHEHISGGSSSGSGMVVASGHVPVAIGSDTGGSVRLPAAFCGVTGLKPTQYRISVAGVMPLAPSLDCVGVLGRSTELCGWTWMAMAGADPRDPSCLDLPSPSLGWMSQAAADFTLAVPRLAPGPLLSADMARAFDEAVAVLRRAGVRCIPVELPDLDLYGRLASVLLAAESAAIHRHWLASRAGEYGRQVRRRLSRGLLVGAMDYYDALRLRVALLRQFVNGTLGVADALLLPTMPDVAPRVDSTIGGDETRLEQEFSRLSFWTRGINYLGVPALSVPAGTGAHGLPLAVQFVGRPLAEDRVLALGCCFQRETRWHTRKP